SPSRDGQAAAKPSYVTRPSSSASELRVSSSLNWSPASPRLNWKDQPPCRKSSAPPGSSMTPSSETNSVMTILAIVDSPQVSMKPASINASNDGTGGSTLPRGAV